MPPLTSSSSNFSACSASALGGLLATLAQTGLAPSLIVILATPPDEIGLLPVNVSAKMSLYSSQSASISGSATWPLLALALSHAAKSAALQNGKHSGIIFMFLRSVSDR